MNERVAYGHAKKRYSERFRDISHIANDPGYSALMHLAFRTAFTNPTPSIAYNTWQELN